MKFTNKTLGWLIILMLVISSNYCSYLAILEHNDIELFRFTQIINILMATVLDIVGFVFFVIFLLYDVIKFQFTITNPFAHITESYRQKRLYLSELDKLYHLIAKTNDPTKIDQLLKKKEALESDLGIHP